MKAYCKIMGLLIGSLFYSPDNLAQDEAGSLPSALDFAHYLRENFDITQTAYLTQMGWQLSHSFASADQLKQQWQQALETQVMPFKQYSRINTHALMAQTLIQYTNGMTLNRWRTVDLESPPMLPPFADGLKPDQAFQIWVNLPYFWQQILDSPTNENVSWLEFVSDGANQKYNSERIPSHTAVLSLLNKNNDLSQILVTTDKQVGHYGDLAVALLRQQNHLNTQQWLAFTNDWIEIYQLLELSQILLTAIEQQQLQILIDRAKETLTTYQNDIEGIDTSLFSVFSLLLEELPQKFKNPDHFNSELNQQFLMLALDIDDVNSYLTHPIRESVQENLEVCLNLSVSQSPDPRQPIATNQFESCFNDFTNWATTVATDSTFTGNQVRLDNPASLHRALELPSFQITNILSMQAISDESCQQQLKPQVNILEWLLATESLAWFHDRWPGLFAEYDKSTEFSILLSMGKSIHNYPNCFNQQEILQSQFTNLKSKWERLKQEINNQIDDYAKEQLHHNTDVNLFGSMDQKTNYVPQDMVIAPCDVTTSCGAFIELKPTVELLNLFPNHVKLASQFGLGTLSICYDNVHWQHKKTAPTHLDNNKIANFEGQLAMQLNGMFGDNTVFSQQLVSEQRHVYLFGENNQATLEMDCPLSIVGKQINTSLDRGTFGLLPNRLTFLTAQKVDINKVIKNNWESWLTAIKTEPEEFLYYDEMKGLKSSLNDAFLSHVNRLQQQIYRKITTNNLARINDSALSKTTFDYLNQRKLLRYTVTGLFPHTYNNHSDVRAALTGNRRLMDAQFFKAALEKQINIIEMMDLGDQLFAEYESSWIDNLNIEVAGGFINATLNELQSFILKPQ